MSTILEGLRKYFRETPQEKIISDWAKSEEFDNIGPPIDEFIESSKKYYAVECPETSNFNQIVIANLNNNPKFNPSGLIL